MSKIVYIKLTKASPKSGPFNISDLFGNIIDTNVPRNSLINGMTYTIDDDINIIVIDSLGECNIRMTFNVSTVSPSQIANSTFVETKTACLWRHLTRTDLYNNFYRTICPYVIEYPFSTLPNTEIIQNIKDFSKVFEYIPTNDGVFSYTDKIAVDDKYFNKLVVYNDQQSSGILELVSKPKNNMKEYMKYPLYNIDSKTIMYTKSDNFYNVNNFYDVVKDKTKQLFTMPCTSLSAPKNVNQENMIYTQRSFHKAQLRAKDCRVRFTLDNSSSIHIVSQIVINLSQISYK